MLIRILFYNNVVKDIEENVVVAEAVEYHYPDVTSDYRDFTVENRSEWREDGWLYLNGERVCKPMECE